VSAVKKGANLLVDSSNTGWFKYSRPLGEQMVAFTVMRAVENHRSFVFCTALGPSVIVDPNGRELKRTFRDQSVVLEADVPLESDTTAYTCYFGF
jgi:apolipoprotein N-acyltransferase